MTSKEPVRTYKDVLDVIVHLMDWEAVTIHPATTMVTPFSDTTERMGISIDGECPEMWLAVVPPDRNSGWEEWEAWVEKDGVVCRLPAIHPGEIELNCKAMGKSRAEVIHSVLWALVSYLGNGGHRHTNTEETDG